MVIRSVQRIGALVVALFALSLVVGGSGRSQPAYGGEQECVSRAAAPPVARYAEVIARARTIACERLARAIPGLAIAVALNGEIVWSEAFGYADLEARVPATPATQFRIGSVSKPITAAALARLVEDGKLDLDAPVQRYVPSFPDKGHPITTRQLAGHLGGIRHYRGDEFLLNQRFGSVSEALAIFKDDSLLHAPGTRFAYSSYGWNLVSAVVEAAAGEPFLAHIHRRVFAPLRLTSTAPDKNDSVIPGRTRFYERATGGGFRLAPVVDNSYKWAGGGFLSTAEDLVRLGSAHLAPGLLRAETLELLFTPQRTASRESTTYGIGWSISRDTLGHRVVAHGGGAVGGTTLLRVDRDSKLVVAVVSNLSGAQLGEAAREIVLLWDRAVAERDQP
ncbi:MAG TPA: serine hydrolase domain-containing protein [Gemmatimonadales bacterium]